MQNDLKTVNLFEDGYEECYSSSLYPKKTYHMDPNKQIAQKIMERIASRFKKGDSK